MKKLIAILLLMSVLMLSSCEYLPFLSSDEQSSEQGASQDDEKNIGNFPDWDFYPEGYTGGFPNYYQPGNYTEIWWVETYEECIAAIELLKSHGSSFKKSVIFSYEGDLFDTKYCFRIPLDYLQTEEIKFGDNPFDRRGCAIVVETYAFHEDVTIDEINYSDIRNYKVSTVMIEPFVEIDNPDFCIEDVEETYYEWNAQKDYYEIFDSKTGLNFLIMGRFDYENDPIYADSCADAVLGSIEFIVFDNP